MTLQTIKNELDRIYIERISWNGAKGLFDKRSIMKRQLVLIKQWVLYKIKRAKDNRNREEETFNLKIYKVINRYLKL